MIDGIGEAVNVAVSLIADTNEALRAVEKAHDDNEGMRSYLTELHGRLASGNSGRAMSLSENIRDRYTAAMEILKSADEMIEEMATLVNGLNG